MSVGPRAIARTVLGAALAAVAPDEAIRRHVRRDGRWLRVDGESYDLAVYRRIAAGGASIIALVLSDVVGSPLDVIASGPAAPDPSTFADAGAVLERYALWERVPGAVAAHLRAGRVGDAPETPKPGAPELARVRQ